MSPDVAKHPLAEINLPGVRTTGIPHHGTSERSLHWWAWPFIQRVEVQAGKCLWLWRSWFIQVYWAPPHHHALHCAMGSGDMGRSPVSAPQVVGEACTCPMITQQQTAAYERILSIPALQSSWQCHTSFLDSLSLDIWGLVLLTGASWWCLW